VAGSWVGTPHHLRPYKELQATAWATRDFVLLFLGSCQSNLGNKQKAMLPVNRGFARSLQPQGHYQWM